MPNPLVLICGKCGEPMTPSNSRIHPELFLHDSCLPDDLKPKEPTLCPHGLPGTNAWDSNCPHCQSVHHKDVELADVYKENRRLRADLSSSQEMLKALETAVMGDDEHGASHEEILGIAKDQCAYFDHSEDHDGLRDRVERLEEEVKVLERSYKALDREANGPNEYNSEERDV